MSNEHQGHIRSLDGLRGVAALWVLLGHTLVASGWRLPVLTSPYAVDLFIMISGFLMAFHFHLRQDREPWPAPSTWARFWIRRVFRIAPLYYVVLALGLGFGVFLQAGYAALDAVASNPTPAGFFHDTSLANILLHLSFLFGLVTPYDAHAPLPDWSISLEMQFYLIFPFLMLLGMRIGIACMTSLLAMVSVALLVLFPSYFASFFQPSPLPMRLPLFLSGMLVASVLWERRRTWRIALAVLLPVVTLAAFPGAVKPVAIDCGLVATFTALVASDLLPVGEHARGWLRSASRRLGGRPFGFMADVSYGVYLIHMPLLFIASGVAARYFGVGVFAPLRFFALLAMILPATYLLAWIAYRLIEQPAISLGRLLIGRIWKSVPPRRPLADSTAQRSG